MILKPTVHPLAQQHLRELRERWGVDPTLEESIWIVRLCERVLCPCDGERSDLCGIPVRVGISDVYLWPLTIGAAVWYQDYASRWWAGNVERLTMALGFALAFSRDREHIRAAALGKEAAERLIRNWAVGVNAEKNELSEAFDEVLPPPPADKGRNETPPKIDWEQIVGEIEAATGIPADHWLWDMSKEATLRAWHRTRCVLLARAGGSVAPSSALDPLTIALQELANAKTAIINAHKDNPA